MPSPHPIRFVAAPPGHLGAIRAVVTERTGGVSTGPFTSLNLGRFVPDAPAHVAANELRVAAALRFDPDRVARIRLEHGPQVVTAGAGGDHGIADALVSDGSRVVLSVTVADCYPVAFTAPQGFALAHCGWRGVVRGVIEATVEKLLERRPVERPRQRAAVEGSPERAPTATVPGRAPDALSVWIGPGIEAACYPVGPEVAEQFPAQVVTLAARARDAGPDAAERFQLDLASEIERRLLAIGVPPARIARAGLCTACHADRFFSHRRDGFPSGRMAAFVWDPSHADRSGTAAVSSSSSS